MSQFKKQDLFLNSEKEEDKDSDERVLDDNTIFHDAQDFSPSNSILYVKPQNNEEVKEDINNGVEIKLN